MSEITEEEKFKIWSQRKQEEEDYLLNAIQEAKKRERRRLGA